MDDKRGISILEERVYASTKRRRHHQEGTVLLGATALRIVKIYVSKKIKSWLVAVPGWALLLFAFVKSCCCLGGWSADGAKEVAGIKGGP